MTGKDVQGGEFSPRDHVFVPSNNPRFGETFGGGCDHPVNGSSCGWPRMAHNPDAQITGHVYQGGRAGGCSFILGYDKERGDSAIRCWYGRSVHADQGVGGPAVARGGEVVRMADVAQYAREPMPDAARGGITVTLIDAPTDPLGTLAVLSGIYTGRVARSKTEVTDEQRREALEAMLATVLSGPLESIQFTFLVEGVSRSITHQMVRNRFSFFAQESLRFAVAEDWAQEIPLPPSLAGLPTDHPLVLVWRRGLNQAEDSYAALVAAGMPAEEARGLLPHDITTRLYWTVSLRTLLMEAGKRTCTQAQFPWRTLFAGVAKAFRDRSSLGWGQSGAPYLNKAGGELDGWQYEQFAQLIRPVCYQQGRCGFMAKFDRGCTIRERVDAFSAAGVPSSEWGKGFTSPHMVDNGCGGLVPDVVVLPINPAEWAADPGAARVTE